MYFILLFTHDMAYRLLNLFLDDRERGEAEIINDVYGMLQSDESVLSQYYITLIIGVFVRTAVVCRLIV